jgi:hypothetical protein
MYNEQLCRKAIAKLNPPMTAATLPAVCEVLIHQAQFWRGLDAKDIPALHEWIAGRRWE